MDETPILPGREAEAGEAPPAEYVTVSRAEIDALRRLAAGSAGTGDEAAAPPPPTPRAQPSLNRDRDRGDDSPIARELAARDRRLTELEASFKGAVRDREIATALAGKPLVAGAAAQLMRLWRDDFDAYEEGGLYKVVSKDGRSVGQVVNEWLGSAEFSHFCLPISKGGAGARDVNRPAPATPPPAPRSLGEAVVMKWREESASKPDNLLKPIGLRRHR